jgi:hypothetical protein
MTMDALELQRLRVSFFSIINNVEMEYSYYFCLHSIQKGLDRIESIYDHFRLDQETLEFHFKLDSDLPLAIREIIWDTHQQIFSQIKTA